MTSALQMIGTTLLGWVLWKVFQRSRSPLANLKGPPMKSWITGHLFDLLTPAAWDLHAQLAVTYGGLLRLELLFRTHILYVFDPKALHHILVKDNYNYDETESFFAGNELMFGKGLLATGGDHHRKQRKMLNPVFSMGHMRRMVPTFYHVMTKLRSTIEGQVQHGPREIDICHWMTRAALELIGQSGLGYSFDPLTEGGTEHPYSVAVKHLTPAMHKLNFWRLAVVPIVGKWGPACFRRFVVDVLSTFWGDLRRARDIIDVMAQTSVAIYDEKKRALAAGDEAMRQQIGGGNDIISILMRANLQASEEDRMPVEEVLGQISTLTFAAMDTTSNALSRILDVLSQNQAAQDRLRREIRDATAAHGSELNYDVLMGLPYLDAVIRETLRLYPPVAFLMRETKCDMVLPISKPVVGLDGHEISEIVVPKGTKIALGILSANRNPDLWGPDVYEWKPERWLSPLPEKLVKAKVPGVYSHLMTFLAGGRSCIGFKFSELEMKVALTVLIENMKFTSLGKNIVWQMTGISQPTVDEPGYDREKPRLPMKVERLQ